MPQEKWLVDGPKTIDVENIRKLKVGLISGQVDIVGHDEPGVRVEIHSVSGRELKVAVEGDTLEIDHPQLNWDNWLDVFTSFRGNARADLSIMVPRDIALKFGVVNAEALISGIHHSATISTVNGDLVIDGLTGDLQVNSISGEISVRDHTGKLTVHAVNGDVTVSGAITTMTSETVSGDVFADLSGTPDLLRISTVSGSITTRLDAGVPVGYTINTVNGRLQLDDAEIRGVRGRYTSKYGELDGRWLDFRANTVNGDISVLHATRAPENAAPSGGDRMTPPVFAHGHLRLYLLSLLAERPMHGYELIQALSDRFGGTYVPSAGTIYPRLAKLEEDGLVTKETDGRKTVYSITETGRAELSSREGELGGIEDELSDSVRRLANEVRTSVTDAMKTLRADLAAAARDARGDTGTAGRADTRGERPDPSSTATSPTPPAPTSTESSDDPRVQARMALRDAEAAINEFRQQLRADLRTEATNGRLEQSVVSLLTTRLTELRRDVATALRG